MSLDKQRIRGYLKAFDFKTLFIEVLGWDYYSTQPLSIAIDRQIYVLHTLVEKRGMVVYICDPGSNGTIPLKLIRRKIEAEVARTVREHIIIYIDAGRDHQIWQWAHREPGQPTTYREYDLYGEQSGESLIQRLPTIAFTLEEEDEITIVQVAGRVRRAFDVDSVTRHFYERFTVEHVTFLKFINGIPSEPDRQWYTSLMFNRLMFIYFIQKKGFLDGDTDYLPNRLRKIREGKSTGNFLSFYRDFLLCLFHEGLSKQARPPEIQALLGDIPYLNGGLFDEHELERDNPDIQIPDEAFESFFNFLDGYRWPLDERPEQDDKEINPDVLGYIFEKYINQKQMGAYYTKEDITGYIARNTIIPTIFDLAKSNYPDVFEPSASVWQLLRDTPDLYVHDTIKEAGYLRAETLQEYAARQARYAETLTKLSTGEITNIEDLITLNLNILQFTQDVIENCTTPALLNAFYEAITSVKILDPACGSGAFLLAALRILEPLYETCLDRMQAIVDETDIFHRNNRLEPSTFLSRFRNILKQVQQHSSRHFFVLKSIIINNLYGVDVIKEATEICKLRLFLKLVAPIERVEDLEPLPDIDFNIRAGNTLVGFGTYDEVKKAVVGDQQKKMDFDNTMGRIAQKAEEVERGFEHFRKLHTQLGIDSSILREGKRQLHSQLKGLNAELNHYLAREYGVDPNDTTIFKRWRENYQPFHWFIEFYGIMRNGGFDVIIGNPPYIEYAEVKTRYQLLPGIYKTSVCGNLYAYFIERSIALLKQHGRWGMIVPLSAFATERMQSLQRLIIEHASSLHLSFLSGDANPSRLFEGVKFRLGIGLARAGTGGCTCYSTKYVRWYAEERHTLFGLLQYCRSTDAIIKGSLPKIGHEIELAMLEKMAGQPPLCKFTGFGDKALYYHNCPVNWIRATTFVPAFRSDRDGTKVSTQLRQLNFQSERLRDAAICIINSSLFFWHWLIYSDCYHLTEKEIGGFLIDLDQLTRQWSDALTTLSTNLMKDYRKNSKERMYVYKTTGVVVYDEFYPKLSKSIIDEIDWVLAQHYGFTGEELDFITNYEIKYRMGQKK